MIFIKEATTITMGWAISAIIAADQPPVVAIAEIFTIAKLLAAFVEIIASEHYCGSHSIRACFLHFPLLKS